jgi:hypothetical protein
MIDWRVGEFVGWSIGFLEGFSLGFSIGAQSAALSAWSFFSPSGVLTWLSIRGYHRAVVDCCRLGKKNARVIPKISHI